MNEARRLLRESLEFLDEARKDLEECQKIQSVSVNSFSYLINEEVVKN